MSLRLSETGVEYLSLDENIVPEVAKKLFNTMTDYGRAIDIIPDDLKPIIV